MRFSKKYTKRDKSTNKTSSSQVSENKELAEKLIFSLLGKEEIAEFVDDVKNRLDREDIVLPVEIFAQELSPAEAVVKYLKEEKQISFHKIALKLNRDERGIWSSYARAKKKKPTSFKLVESVAHIPIRILGNRKLSILEAVVFYLKEEGFDVAEIAKILKKNKSTIYTVYGRAKTKRGGKK